MIQDHVDGRLACQPWGRMLVQHAGDLRLMDGMTWKGCRTGQTLTPIEYTALPPPLVSRNTKMGTISN